MRRRTCQMMLFGAAIAATTLYFSESTSARATKGYKSTLLAVGQFGEMDILNSFSRGLKSKENEQLWLSLKQTKGMSDVYVMKNVWAPGGSTGWHSHPGNSLIIVTAGTVTDYEGHDPACKPHVYTTGMGFVDYGGDHVHIIRNESTVEAQTIAIQMIPAGAARRIEIANPGYCDF
jgi:hypothetical protein